MIKVDKANVEVNSKTVSNCPWNRAFQLGGDTSYIHSSNYNNESILCFLVDLWPSHICVLLMSFVNSVHEVASFPIYIREQMLWFLIYRMGTIVKHVTIWCHSYYSSKVKLKHRNSRRLEEGRRVPEWMTCCGLSHMTTIPLQLCSRWCDDAGPLGSQLFTFLS